MNKYYKHPWDEGKENIVKMWWPHWGVHKVAKMVNLTPRQVKCKVDKLKLKMLPKIQRLCIKCETNKQSRRMYGFLCRKCYLIQRRDNRLIADPKPKAVWMKEILRTLKHRSIKRHNQTSNLSLEYLLWLWEYQNGKCFYSGIEMSEPSYYGRGRKYTIASVDRIDSNLGYVKGNVVWACWGCNTAKQDFTIEQFIDIARKVTKNSNNIPSKINLLKEILKDDFHQ